MQYLVLALLLLCISAPGQADGNRRAGQEKSDRCAACHGAEGKAVIPIYPNLAGQNAPWLVQALQAYKSGARSGGQAEMMKAFVAGLSDEDIDDLAAYYAGLKP